MIQGEAKIKANLKKQMKIAAKTKTEGLIEIGERGVGILKLNTPVKEGRLRGSMSYTIDNKSIDPLGAFDSKDKLPTISTDKTVVVGTNVIYAPRVEFLSQTGSAGFMLRSYKQLKPKAEEIMKKIFGRKGF